MFLFTDASLVGRGVLKHIYDSG